MLASLPLVSYTQSVAALAVVLGIVAFTDVGVDIGMNLQGSWLSANRNVSVMNRLHGLWSLGSVVGGVLAAQATANQISLQTHLIAVAVSLAMVEIGVGFSLLGRHQFPGDGELGHAGPDHQTDPGTADLSGSSKADDVQERTNGSVGRNVALVLAALGAAAIAMEMTTTDWASFRLGDDLSIGTEQVGFGFVAFTSGMVVGRFSGDWIESRIGTRVLVRSAAVLAGTGIAIATLIPRDWLDPSGHLAVSLLGYFVAALGVSVIFPQLYDAAAKAPGPPGRALGAMTAGSRVATLILPVVVGVLADSQLSVGAAVALVTLPGCALIFILRTTTGQPQPAGETRSLH